MSTYQYVRRYNAVLTEEQQARHTTNRAAMDAVFNHIVAHLEKRYPYNRKRLSLRTQVVNECFVTNLSRRYERNWRG